MCVDPARLSVVCVRRTGCVFRILRPPEARRIPDGGRATRVGAVARFSCAATHGIAPCISRMYEILGRKENQRSGPVFVETDDPLGGEIGDKYLDAVAELRRQFKFGKWMELMEIRILMFDNRRLKQRNTILSHLVPCARKRRCLGERFRTRRRRLLSPRWTVLLSRPDD